MGFWSTPVGVLKLATQWGWGEAGSAGNRESLVSKSLAPPPGLGQYRVLGERATVTFQDISLT